MFFCLKFCFKKRNKKCKLLNNNDKETALIINAERVLNNNNKNRDDNKHINNKEIYWYNYPMYFEDKNDEYY